MLTSEVQVAFETLKKACLEVPVLAFDNFNKPFLLETNASKLGLGAVLLQKQSDRWYHPVAYVSWSLTIHECNYYSTKQEFLTLKWVIAEQFQEYLHWKPFIVITDNNLLNYILTTLNLGAVKHFCVESLAGFTFSITYQKGRDNAVADALSHVTSKLNAEAMKSILDRVTIETAERANAYDPTVAKADERIHQQVEETAVQGCPAHTCVNLNVLDWVAVQLEDPILKIVMEWISSNIVQDLRHLLGDHTIMEEGMSILREKFTPYQDALYHCQPLAGDLEEALWLVVPTAHRVTARNRCHRDMGYQGQWQMVSLLQDQFWWPGMVMRIQKVISRCDSCERCIQHEGAQVKAPLQAILVTSPWELLHVDFTGIGMTMELDWPTHIVNVLVFCDHFMRYVMAYVTPDQMVKTLAKFLWQGYILIFRALAKLLSNQEATFESNIISELCEPMGIWKVRTSLYHPQTSGQVEWVHQTLMQMIEKLGKDQKSDWPKHLLCWCMLTTPWDQPPPGKAHIIWCLSDDCAVCQLVFSHSCEHRKMPACQSLHCWLMGVTVQSLQRSASAVLIWGWKAEVILWSQGQCHFTGIR